MARAAHQVLLAGEVRGRQIRLRHVTGAGRGEQDDMVDTRRHRGVDGGDDLPGAAPRAQVRGRDEQQPAQPFVGVGQRFRAIVVADARFDPGRRGSAEIGRAHV
jgi:hypothetical protein